MQSMCGMPCGRFWPLARSADERRLAGVGWGLFFLWTGLSFLLDVGWGIGLLGVGLLTLTMQVVRSRFGLSAERFWIFVGGALTLAGVWELAAIEASLGSLLLIGFGAALLVLSFRPKGEG
jgi:hypothetical protein